jgi:hypothetical protein
VHLGQVARHQLHRALEVHDVDLVGAHVLLQRGGELRAFSLLDRDEVLDAIVSSTWPPKRSATTPVRMPLRAA